VNSKNMYNFMHQVSATCLGLCAWVINIIKFYEVFCEVEPKRIALADANAELAAAQEKLRMIKEQIEVKLLNLHFQCYNIGLHRIWKRN
jgi:dynein heavy chain, axonemal